MRSQTVGTAVLSGLIIACSRSKSLRVLVGDDASTFGKAGGAVRDVDDSGAPVTDGGAVEEAADERSADESG